jgi:hypothetical protein
MININFLTKRSLVIVFLVSNSFNPLLALPQKTNTTIENEQKSPSIYKDIQNILVNNGLENKTATDKLKKLLNNNQKSTADKLLHLCNDSLSVTKEKLTEALSRYALLEKSLDLNSYGSIVGLLQSMSIFSLDKKQLEYVKKIASL